MLRVRGQCAAELRLRGRAEQCSLRLDGRVLVRSRARVHDPTSEGLDPRRDRASLSLPCGGEARSRRCSARSRPCASIPSNPEAARDAGPRQRHQPQAMAATSRACSRRSSGSRESDWPASRHPRYDRSEHEARAGPEARKNLSLEFTQEWGDQTGKKAESSPKAFERMSDGTLRAIGLLAAVFQRPVPSLVAVEEPRRRSTPARWIGSRSLRHASKNMQVVVTTHSPELLDAKWIVRAPAHRRMAAMARPESRPCPRPRGKRCTIM